jgi:hypothetical protein
MPMKFWPGAMPPSLGRDGDVVIWSETVRPQQPQDFFRQDFVPEHAAGEADDVGFVSDVWVRFDERKF